MLFGLSMSFLLLPLALLFVTALPRELEQRLQEAEVVETTTIAALAESLRENS